MGPQGGHTESVRPTVQGCCGSGTGGVPHVADRCSAGIRAGVLVVTVTVLRPHERPGTHAHAVSRIMTSSPAGSADRSTGLGSSNAPDSSDGPAPAGSPDRPLTAAFYARRGGPLWDWWTVLHPPYTLWHLSYVAIGAALAPHVAWWIVGATVLAFAFAVGVAAHALDEWHGRPLRTGISDRGLWIAAIVSLAAAVALGISALSHAGLVLIPFVVVGVVLVLGYNLELFDGALHTDLGFALAWGAFPTAVGYVAQAPPLNDPRTLAAVCAVAAATALSAGQRRLSTPARMLRRKTAGVTGVIELGDGSSIVLDRAALLAPLDAALRLLSYAMPALAAAALLARLGHW